MNPPEIPGVEFRRDQKWPYEIVVAIVFTAVDVATRERILKVLPSQGVKHNILLAKKWKVWAVYASETWAFEHRDDPAPKPTGKSWLEQKTTPVLAIAPVV